MIRRSAPCSARAIREGMFSRHFLKSEKSSKIHMDRGFNSDSRIYNEWIKISTNGCVLTSFHAKFDHRTRRHEEELMASVWHLDKSEKILEKLSKIACQMWNVITKNCSILKAFDEEKGSPNLGETRRFCTCARLPFFQFFSVPKISEKIHLML